MVQILNAWATWCLGCVSPCLLVLQKKNKKLCVQRKNMLGHCTLNAVKALINSEWYTGQSVGVSLLCIV